MKELSREIVFAQRKCLEGQRNQLAQWAELHFALGRAMQASEAGTPDVRIWLDQAADQEYALLGDCERIGAVITKLEGK